jgi:hypothetical protein
VSRGARCSTEQTLDPYGDSLTAHTLASGPRVLELKESAPVRSAGKRVSATSEAEQQRFNMLDGLRRSLASFGEGSAGMAESSEKQQETTGDVFGTLFPDRSLTIPLARAHAQCAGAADRVRRDFSAARSP